MIFIFYRHLDKVQLLMRIYCTIEYVNLIRKKLHLKLLFIYQ